MSVYTSPAGVGSRVGSGRWQDWINLILGIWLFITPWIWGPVTAPYVASTTAGTSGYTATAPANTVAPGAPGYVAPANRVTPAGAYTTTTTTRNGNYASEWNAWILGVIIAVIAAVALASGGFAGVEWINTIAAIWLFISPWVLRFSYGGMTAAAWNAWIVGVIVFFLSISAAQMRSTRVNTTAVPPTA